ncbi:MAG TPA: glycosyltransferase [Chthoniobacterales bacterium]|jgi:glycosyltransferase involved in cell wall biosynthesis|nr:glycosyltransferase [Chthoniobacterales bacterium]
MGSRALKVLQLVHTLDPSVGGVAAAVVSLSRGIASRGHKIDIVVLDDSASPWLVDFGLPVHALGVGLTSYRYSPKLSPWLKEHGGNYDHVIINGIWQYLSFAAWRRYAGSPIPYFVFPHGMLDPWFKETFPLKHLKKWLYWPWTDYRVLRDAAAVIFTSEEERLLAHKSFWLYRARERVSPLGVESPPPVSPQSREGFFARFPQLRNKRVLLFLGRLHPKKGCDILIDAFGQIADDSLALVLAGPDQVGWQSELQRHVDNLNLGDRVVFPGMLQGETKQAALTVADAFILPSHQENFGMAVVEALAMGLPVLISNRINIWREVDQDGAGYVESDDFSGTVRLLNRWIAAPQNVRDGMRANARRCFEQRFEINKSVDSLLQILTESVPTR